MNNINRNYFPNLPFCTDNQIKDKDRKEAFRQLSAGSESTLLSSSIPISSTSAKTASSNIFKRAWKHIKDFFSALIRKVDSAFHKVFPKKNKPEVTVTIKDPSISTPNIEQKDLDIEDDYDTDEESDSPISDQPVHLSILDQPIHLTDKKTEPVKQSKSIAKVTEPVGIKNGGQNCYAIATLQALFNQPAFLEKIDQDVIADIDLPPTPFLAEQKKKLRIVHQELKKFKEIFQSFSTSKQIHEAMIQLRNTIFSLNFPFKTENCGNQEDAAELCEVILDAVNYSFKQQIHTYAQVDTGYAESKENQKYQIFQVSIDQSKKPTNFRDLIQNTILEEINDKENGWRKDGYGSIEKYTKKMQITDLPSFLCIHLKRFEKGVKISTKYKLEQEIVDFSDFILSKESKPSLYHLSGCVVHLGSTQKYGHYISYVRKNNQWFCCNDNMITSVDAKEVLQAEGYMYFFEKVEETPLLAIEAAPNIEINNSENKPT